MSVIENQQLLTPTQVADRLQVGVQLLNQWRSSRKGPPFCKVGGFVRYGEKDLQNWIDQSTVKTDLKLI
jgi:hypothetical protein